MNSVELVIQICKERKIPIKKLEQDCGFSNGYIRGLRQGKFPAPRLYKVAEYLKVSPEYLAGVSKNEKYDELLNMFNQLNEKGKLEVQKYIRLLLKDEQYTSAFPSQKEKRA